MSPEDVKQLRRDLKLSARDLAEAIKADAEDVWAWENGERFPTKRFITRMLALRKKGAQPTATPQPASSRAQPLSGLHALADPTLWQVIRKLLAHPKLLADVIELAKAFPDPAVPGPQRQPDA